jgi:hypothetical protein
MYSDLELKSAYATLMETPKKLRRTLKKLEAEGEEPLLIFPVLLERYATQQMLAMTRIGMGDDQKIFSWLVVTRKNVYFVRTGIMWDRVQTVPLDKIEDVAYVKEFHTNTLRLKVGGAAENIVFYEDVDGIKFYQYIKNRQAKES